VALPFLIVFTQVVGEGLDVLLFFHFVILYCRRARWLALR
jgi:hypothetical protein